MNVSLFDFKRYFRLMRLLDRYLIRLLLSPFVFGVGAFILLFVASNLLLEVTRLMMKYDLTWTEVEGLFIYGVPRFLVLTFPMATLVAVLLAFGRLSGESELVAIYAAGVSFLRLMIPVVATALLISALTLAAGETVVPRANQAGEELLRRAINRSGGAASAVVIREENQGRLKRATIVQKIDPSHHRMENVHILDYGPDGRPQQESFARRGRWEGEGKIWRLYDGWTRSESGWMVTNEFREQVVTFSEAPPELALQGQQPNEMSYWELKGEIDKKRAEGKTKGLSEMEVELHHKLSIPFSSLVFALLGAPLGVRTPRGGRPIGVGLAFLIIFCYYIIWHYFGVLAERERFSPLLAAWLPNILFGSGGITLIGLTGR